MDYFHGVIHEALLPYDTFIVRAGTNFLDCIRYVMEITVVNEIGPDLVMFGPCQCVLRTAELLHAGPRAAGSSPGEILPPLATESPSGGGFPEGGRRVARGLSSARVQTRARVFCGSAGQRTYPACTGTFGRFFWGGVMPFLAQGLESGKITPHRPAPSPAYRESPLLFRRGSRSRCPIHSI